MAARARPTCPAETSPGALTTSTRRAPSSRASAPRRASEPGPKTSRVRTTKSKPAGSTLAPLPATRALHGPAREQEVEEVAFVRLVPAHGRRRDRAEVEAPDPLRARQALDVRGLVRDGRHDQRVPHPGERLGVG